MISQVAFDIIVSGCTIALCGLSFTLIYAVSRRFYVSHGAVYVAGAYLAIGSQSFLHAPLAMAAIGGALGAGAIGAICARYVYDPLERRRTSPLAMLIASLGVYVILQNAISLIWGDATGSLSGVDMSSSVTVLGVGVTSARIGLVVLAIASTILLTMLLRRTRLGTMYRAIADDTMLAQTCGVPVRTFQLASFAVGSALAGMTAVLVSLDTGVNPTMGLSALILGFVAMVAGGVGRPVGPLLGGLVLATLQRSVSWWLGGSWEEATALAFLVLLLLVRPVHTMAGRIGSGM